MTSPGNDSKSLERSPSRHTHASLLDQDSTSIVAGDNMIHPEAERERERERYIYICIHEYLCVYIYICIRVYLYIYCIYKY